MTHFLIHFFPHKDKERRKEEKREKYRAEKREKEIILPHIFKYFADQPTLHKGRVSPYPL